MWLHINNYSSKRGRSQLQEQCQRYLQLLDELQQLMKQTSNVGVKLGEQMVEDLDWRIVTLLSDLRQLEIAIMLEAG